MECLKCGRETDQTFCEECRAVMEKHPVKPGTVVQLLNRDTLIPQKKAPRKVKITPEQRIQKLKKQVVHLHWINSILAALVLVLCMVVYLLYNRSTRPITGQNYTTNHSATETTAVIIENTEH